MTRRAIILSFAVAVLATGNLFAQTLGAVLTGSQESPPCSTSGFGNATVTFDSARQNIIVNITVANLGSSITGAEITRSAGPAVVAFTPTASFTTSRATARRRI